MDKIKVLIVEDEPIARKVLKQVIKWEDHDMVVIGEVNNGEEALRFLDKEHVDLISTDIKMPFMDGNSMIKKVKSRLEDINFIVISSFLDFNLVRTSFKLGAIDYISKSDINSPAMNNLLKEVKQKIYAKKNKSNINIISSTIYGDKFNNIDVSSNISVIAVLLNMSDVNELKSIETAIKQNMDYVFTKDKYYFVVVNHSEFNSCKIQNSLSVTTAKLYKLLEDYGIKDFTLGISNTDSKMKLQELIEQSLSAVSIGYCSDKSIINYRELDQRKGICNYNELKIKLNEAIRTFKIGQVRSLFNELYREIEASKPDKETCCDLILDVYFYVLNYFYDSDLLPSDFEYDNMKIREIVRKLPNFSKVISWINDNIEKLEKYYKDLYSKDLVYAIKLFINMNISKKLSLKEAAQQFNLSEGYLSNVFSKRNAMSFKSYVIGKKMEKAKEYLLNTELKVREISEILGYRNTEHFSRLFKEEVGESPTAFRKKPLSNHNELKSKNY